jgi:hypothetical protein
LIEHIYFWRKAEWFCVDHIYFGFRQKVFEMIVIFLQWELLEEGCSKNFSTGCDCCMFILSFCLCADSGVPLFLELRRVGA